MSKLNETEEEKIYVINGIKDEEIGVIDISNGEEFDIYIAINEETSKELEEKGFRNKTYQMSKDEFYRLELGKNIIIKDRKCSIYNEKIEIKNSDAWEKLENLYFNLQQEEGRSYIINKITDKKIYMNDIETQGYYEVYRELYPEWKIGDKILRKDGKYIREESDKKWENERKENI